jgi:deoxyribodipyrimidine photo-lyase
MSKPRILILLLRRDLRLHDNPIFNALCNKKTYCHTHVLPVYIFNPSNIEVRGFLCQGQESPYPECRSRVGNFWRCGPHRCKFIAESVWDLKESLKKLDSDLILRVGKSEEVAENIIKSLKQANNDIVGVWMTSLVGTEEAKEERNVEKVATKEGVKFKKFNDGSYLYEE